MNILYVNNAPNNGHGSDYQSDLLLNGLRSIKDIYVCDYPRVNHLYKDSPHRIETWGKGFNIGYLDEIPRLNEEEIKNKKWDLCIFPLHWTIIQDYELQINIFNYLSNNFIFDKMCIIDGWDRYKISVLYNKCQEFGYHYFKRELIFSEQKYLHPIHFGIPESQISAITPYSEKIYDVAPLIPVNQSIDPSYMSTYIYNTEEEYNSMYRNSRFGLTSKKGGWDTLRHYEIVANGCIPWFCDIEYCPKNCLWNWPKALLASLKRSFNFQWSWTQKPENDLIWPNCAILNKDNPGSLRDCDQSLYQEIIEELQTWLKAHGTTRAIAKYVLENI